MISFAPTEEQSIVVSTMRTFAREVLRPAARAADEDEALPEAVLSQAWSLGFVAAQVPEAYGGGGEERSPVTNALVLEALAHGDPALSLAVAHAAAFAFALLDHGTERQKRAWLPPLCGDAFSAGALAVMEPTPAFTPAATVTQARPVDGGFALSGTKCCVPLADRADRFLVLARVVQSGAPGPLAGFVVPRGAAGLSVEPERNLGLRALPTGRLLLEGVRVSREDVLGESTDLDAAHLLSAARAASAAVLVGLSCAVMDYVVPYAKERRAFGQFIAQKQAIAFMLADMRVETDAMRWLTWKAASELERGETATQPAYAAWRYAAEQAMTIADNGLQILGGHGYIREHPIELWYRGVRTLSVLEGLASL
ncbi:MAG: acyl-CoA dehydrogenase family protein [Myxococcales bacterium]|nr:acyl-CoA dehydrogenase family protein [Myxococcales bacterium]